MRLAVGRPNAVTAVIQHLNGSFQVFGDVPATRPKSFVRVAAAGGEGVVNKGVLRARVTVECWDESGVKASDLAGSVADALESAHGFYAECDAPTNFPDPRSSQPRAIFVTDVALAVTS